MVSGDYAALATERAGRARVLADQYPASREVLHFYAAISDFQATHAGRLLIPEMLPAVLPELVDLILRIGPEPLRNAQPASFDDYLRHPDPAQFHSRILLEVWASQTELPPLEVAPNLCPRCGHPPQSGALRKLADGSALTLVCSLCCREWPFRRTTCPSCGEVGKEKVSFYSAPGFEHIQTQACDACHTYLHVIDCARDPHAFPEADEIAALPLDIWAIENGYQKLFPNAIGL